MEWPPRLNARDERLRFAHGLTPKKDGWYKSVDGRTKYICRKLPITEAVALLPARLEEIRSGKTIKPTVEIALTIDRIAEQFLAAMRLRVDTGVPKKLDRRTYDDYVDVIDRFVECVGPDRVTIGPSEFTKFIHTLAGRAKSTIRREVQYVDRLFNWAGPGKRSMNLIPFCQRGPDWIKPSDEEIRSAGVDADKAYSSAQVREAFAEVGKVPLLGACFWFGLACAFIPQDLGTLPENIVDLDTGFIRFPRGKTGVRRLCWLPPEGVDAVKAWLKKRDRLKCHPTAEGLLFRTRMGYPIHRRTMVADEDRTVPCSSLATAWGRAVGLPFSGLRSTFATIADEWHDERAIDMVMGHRSGRVSGHVRARHYAKRFNPDRVKALTAAVVAVAFGRAAHLTASVEVAPHTQPPSETTGRSDSRASA